MPVDDTRKIRSHNQHDDDEESSSSESSDSSRDTKTLALDNTDQIAILYRDALKHTTKLRPQTSSVGLANISKRLSERITLALLAGRLALLRRNWIDLLAALKRLDSAVQTLPDGGILGCRLPITARLIGDAVIATRAAMSSKRRLASDGARALARLTHFLPKQPEMSVWYQELDSVCEKQGRSSWRPGDAVEKSITDCIELAFLSSMGDQIILCNSEIAEVPAMVQNLQRVLDWYTKFGGASTTVNNITKVDLSNTPMSTLPDWLPTVLPRLKILDISGTQLRSLPPFLPLFRDLEELEHTAHTKSNKLSLRDIASAMPRVTSAVRQKKRAENRLVPSLFDMCLENLPEDAIGDLPMHIVQRHSDLHQSYLCASCRQRFMPNDEYFLPEGLRERVTLFNPPVRGGKEEAVIFQEIPVPIKQTAFVIGGDTWRFCGPCLSRHCSSIGCKCIICVEDRRALQQDEAIRWGRMHV